MYLTCRAEQEAQTDSIKMKTRWTQEPAVGLLSAARDDGGYDSDDDEKDIGEQIKQANAQLSKFLVRNQIDDLEPRVLIDTASLLKFPTHTYYHRAGSCRTGQDLCVVFCLRKTSLKTVRTVQVSRNSCRSQSPMERFNLEATR